MRSARAPLTLALLFGSALFVPHANALTSPMTGGVSFPSGVYLGLPFPAGERVRVLSGYGPSAGSSLHNNLDATSFGNDYYALDLVYADEPDGGKGLPLVAVLPGTVVKSGWATEGWANFGLRVILRHDLGDGHVYHSLYAHMNAIDGAVVEGATVAQGQVLGELGGSCQGALSCSSFSTPHIHFSIHRDSNIGGSGTGGSYGGNAVVPEPMDGYEDLARGDILVSGNAGTVECGDGFCTGDETNASCPADCPICENVPAAGRVVDESDLCFERFGSPEFWRTEADGYEASLLWTHAGEWADPDNYGVWSLAFDEAGRYRIEAYTDADWAQARQAGYRVRHGGVEEVFRVDQSAADGFAFVAEVDFSAGGDQWVRLDDNTGEAFADRRQIVFDAIRLTRLDPGPGPVDGGTDPPGDAGPGLDDGGAPTAPDGGTLADAGSAGDAAAVGDAGPTRPSGSVSGGCAAGGRRGGARGALGALLLIALGLRRRR